MLKSDPDDRAKRPDYFLCNVRSEPGFQNACDCLFAFVLKRTHYCEPPLYSTPAREATVPKNCKTGYAAIRAVGEIGIRPVCARRWDESPISPHCAGCAPKPVGPDRAG